MSLDLRPPHARSVLVTPAVTIVASSIAGASVLTTDRPHGFLTGDSVTIAGHQGSTPPLDGVRVVTVLSPTTFSIPLAVTVAGLGGTATRTIAVEPLTLAEAKLRAGLDWVGGDPRDAMLTSFIAAARSKVEQDTGLALLTQTRDVYFDALAGQVIALPPQCTPLQAVIEIASTDRTGAVQPLAATSYVVDVATGRVGLALGAAWSTGTLRPFQPFVMRIIAGYPSVAQLPPLLFFAVGLLAAHYLTAGRDVLQVGHIVATTPFGYEDAIAPYRLETVA